MTIEIYMHPSGSDTNGGLNLQSPILTLGRAQALCREKSPDRNTNIEIFLAPGVYSEEGILWEYCPQSPFALKMIGNPLPLRGGYPADDPYYSMPTFKRVTLNSTWITLPANSQKQTNIHFLGIRVLGFRTGVLCNPSSGNVFDGCDFRDIGCRTTENAPSTSVMVFYAGKDNSTPSIGNVIQRCCFSACGNTLPAGTSDYRLRKLIEPKALEEIRDWANTTQPCGNNARCKRVRSCEDSLKNDLGRKPNENELKQCVCDKLFAYYRSDYHRIFHVFYLKASSHNTFTQNTIVEVSGPPIKVRHSANQNVFHNNYFRRPAYLDPYEHRSVYLDHDPIPSFDNEFTHNIIEDYGGEPCHHSGAVACVYGGGSVKVLGNLDLHSNNLNTVIRK